MKLVILGAGGFGQTAADAAMQLGYEIIFLDDNSPLAVGKTEDFRKYTSLPILPAFGNNDFRLAWCEKIRQAGGVLPTLIHPRAYVSPTAVIGDGTVILPGAVVNTNVKIASGCLINIGALIDHGCVLEDGVHIAPGAVVKAENRISRCTKIESGSVIECRTYPV